jgi:hypothetical protein
MWGRQIFLFLAMTVGFWSYPGQAAVWQHRPDLQWDEAWQKQYADWVETQVKGDFFKSLGGHYAPLSLDCADAHYALIAYFSRMHELPFAVSGGQLTNLESRFDHLTDPEQRMAAFIRHLADTLWTESLVFQDTFPQKVSDLRSGDLYMWKTGSGEGATRHTYIIKKINSNGTFDVLYSTQANAAKAGPLRLRQEYTFPHSPRQVGADQDRWGFRRMKMPQHSAWDQSAVPGASLEQYEWARSMSQIQFAHRVQQTLATVQESSEQVVGRQLGRLCQSVQGRVEVVLEAVAYAEAIGQSCMDFRDFDIHSTPSRDKALMDSFAALEFQLQMIDESGSWGTLSPQTQAVARALFSEQLTPAEAEGLFQFCPIQFGHQPDQQTHLQELRTALFRGEVSFHPNDNLWRRWGFQVGEKTSCQQYYGYPQ